MVKIDELIVESVGDAPPPPTSLDPDARREELRAIVRELLAEEIERIRRLEAR